MTEQPPGSPAVQQRIDSLLTQIRNETAAALEQLTRRREKAEELRAAAEAEQRAYAAEWRAIRNRGLLTVTQLRELGFPAPRARTKRPKPST